MTGVLCPPEGFSGPQVPETVCDRVVTTLLSRVSHRWGVPGLHGAVLYQAGRVMIIFGKSGHGKSTLSQELSRSFGWTVCDDDTFGLGAGDGGDFVFWPMGTKARLRGDVADYLGVLGPTLPGYAGEKKILDHTPHRRGVVKAPAQSCAIFFLHPDPDSDNPSAIPVVRENLPPVAALGPIMDSVMFLDPTADDHGRMRFEAANRLATIDAQSVTYQRGVHTPSQVARILHDALAK